MKEKKNENDADFKECDDFIHRFLAREWLTTEELYDLAKRYCEGKILTDRLVPKHLIPSVFSILLFLDNDTIQNFLDADVQLIYGDLEKTPRFPRYVNGYPMFMGCDMLFGREFDIFTKFVEKIKANEKKLKEEMMDVTTELNEKMEDEKN